MIRLNFWNVLSKRFNSSYLNNIFTLMFGTTTGQAISVIIAPLLTRAYSGSDFGTFALFISTSAIISTFSTVTYQLAIMLPDNDKDAINVAVVSLINTCLFSIITLILIVIISTNEMVSSRFLIEYSWCWYIPITMFLSGLFQTLYYWCNRKERYKVLSASCIAQSIFNGVLSLVLGLNGFGFWGLIYANLFGQVLGTLILGLNFVKNEYKIFKLITLNQILKQFYDYKDFIAHGGPSTFLNVVSYQLPQVLINSFFGTTILGYYYLTLKVLATPITFIGSAVSQVFYQKAVEAERSNSLSYLVSKTTRGLFFISILPFLLILFLGEHLFAIVFGEEWRTAGYMAQIMVPFYTLRFIFSPQSTVITVKRLLKLAKRFNFFFFLGQFVSLMVGYYIWDNWLYSILLMSVCGIIAFLFLGYIIKINSISQNSN